MSEYRLKDLVKIKNGRDHKSLADGVYPVYGSGGLMRMVDSYLYDKPSILLPRKGTLNNIQYSDQPFWTVDTLYYTEINQNKVDAYYLYYYLKLLDLNSLSSGTGVPSMTFGAYNGIKVKLPQLDIQKKISTLLRAIDKKIELNNRINAELEAMAKTLYDYWFVQFDFPDANGKPYKSSGGKMVYNPTLKREIPEGWSDGTLGEIAELYQPKTISEKEMAEDGEFLVYGANGIVGRYDQYNHEQSVVAVTCRGNSCGEINVTRPYSWITGNAMVVNTDSHFLPPTYIYNLLRSSGLENVITGSAQPQITRTNLAPMKIIKPAEKLLISFALLVKPSFEKRMAILDENEKLEKLRDWLLPMLMNGQVTVI